MKLPPIVEPGEMLGKEEITRYSRHILIPDIGMKGQRRLKNSRVLVIGAGGLGSPALLYLAAAGVGTIGIVDFDRVDDSNLQRQVIHNITTVGQLKVDSAKTALQRLNPNVGVNTYSDPLTPETAIILFSEYDLILDCTDNFATRYLINDACVLTGKPYVWGSVHMEGHAKGTLMSAVNLSAYLLGWNELVLKWLDRDATGKPIDFPESDFKWNELGKLAQKFYLDYEAVSWPLLLVRLESAKGRIVSEIAARSDHDLYGLPWYGKWTMGRMIQFNTSSPYVNARNRLRKWMKTKS